MMVGLFNINLKKQSWLNIQIWIFEDNYYSHGSNYYSANNKLHLRTPFIDIKLAPKQLLHVDIEAVQEVNNLLTFEELKQNIYNGTD